MPIKRTDNYDELVSTLPSMVDYIRPEEVNVMRRNNEILRRKFEKLWKSNLRNNCKRLFKKHGTITDDCVGLGRNKAVIAIGAGASFNKNKELLKEIYALNMSVPFEKQPFIFIACNHQFKPLLEMGILPHFVFLLDGTTVVYDQLCKDIPKYARGVTLVAPLRVHHTVTHEWDRQGRAIRFYLGQNEWMEAEFKKVMGYNAHEDHIVVGHGGNVMNQTFLIGVHCLKSSVYMCVGNDLSYDHHDDINTRRKKYYADGDYSTNLNTGRDEAMRELPWMGFKFEESILMPGEYMLKFEPRATTHQLILYKTWVENQLRIQTKLSKASFQYFNCSEGGILGVISKKSQPELDRSDLTEVIKDKDNWYLLDEELPTRYITSTLEKGCDLFLRARHEAINGDAKWGIPIDVKRVAA